MISRSKFHWFWSGKNYFDFNVEFLKEKKTFIRDASFLIFKDNKPCAIIVFVIKLAEKNYKVASYESLPLPWPIIDNELIDDDNLIKLIFDEIDNRAKLYDLAKVEFQLNLNKKSSQVENNFIKTIKNFNYIDKSFLSHSIDLSYEKNISIRPSYLKNMKKHKDNYKIEIIDHRNYKNEFIDEYMELHREDSGGIFRSRRTYEIQFEPVRDNNGFVVCLYSMNKHLVGALLIYHDNYSAYEPSVAVKPSEKKNYISHLLKQEAINHLIKGSIQEFELGQAHISASFSFIPNDKNYQISFFKMGWSKNNYKKIFVAEKYYKKDALKFELNDKFVSLNKYFNIK